ncbi:hypothetical protein DVH24_007958 [Malus domestica]|uniref:Uncharacterized protein n=1 Tax=Malus domestica TaxID=3750 RepID=A0A498JI99_MALDO|nr:hypothetical protein DVH24_007958 [Malus domestica]
MICSINLKNVWGMEQMRYMVLKQMMMHAIDNLQTASVVSSQTTGKLKRDIETLQEEKELNKKKVSDMDAEIQQLWLKNTEASRKVNLLLNDIGILKNKLQENQTKVLEVPIDDQMESREEVSKYQMEEDSSANMGTPKGKNTKDGQEENAEEKKWTRTLVRNIRTRNDHKANVLRQFDYVLIQKNPKKKAKYIYAVSDSESPSIVISQPEQNLEPIIEREKEKRILGGQETEKKKPVVETQKKKPMVETKKKKPMVETKKNKKVLDKEKVKPIVDKTQKKVLERPITETKKHKPMVKAIVDKTKEKPKVVKANPIAKETKRKPAKKTNAKSSKTDKGSYFPATTNAYKFLDDETREKIKEYYRQDEIFDIIFIDGTIDSNIIDASFFIMLKNETKMGQEQNLYLPSFLFASVNKFIYNKFQFVNFINNKKRLYYYFRMT